MKKLMILSFASLAFFFASCGGNSSSTTTGNNDVTLVSDDEDDDDADDATTSAVNLEINNTINIEGNDQMQFDNTQFKVKAGETVTLTLKNIGTLPAEAMSHDVVVLKPGSDIAAIGNKVAASSIDKLDGPEKDNVIVYTKMLGPGESDKITFTLEAGVYPFFCSFPGHYGTMQGTIIAE